VLGDDHVDRRQLLDLMARRHAVADAFDVTEDMAARALRGPVVDDLVHGPRRQQRPTLALMARLAAGLATGRILPSPRRRPRRILARRLRRSARRALRLALQLRDPLILARDPRRQRLDLRAQPLILGRQLHQHAHDDLAALLEDRLRLGPLHGP